MKQKVNPKDCDTEVTGIARTRKGEILITVKSDKNIGIFNKAIAHALEGKAEMR